MRAYNFFSIEYALRHEQHSLEIIANFYRALFSRVVLNHLNVAPVPTIRQDHIHIFFPLFARDDKGDHMGHLLQPTHKPPSPAHCYMLYIWPHSLFCRDTFEIYSFFLTSLFISPVATYILLLKHCINYVFSFAAAGDETL